MNNIKRIRNILSNNYKSKSKISVGYKSKFIERKEGDVWEESGKKYTIKNGIRKTINKLSEIRKKIKIPLTCQCGEILKHKLDKQSWNMIGKCYTCLLREENKYRVNNTYNQYIKNKRNANIKSWLKDAQIEFKDQIQTLNNKQYITEFGNIEDWDNDINKNELIKKQNDQLEKAKKIISE